MKPRLRSLQTILSAFMLVRLFAPAPLSAQKPEPNNGKLDLLQQRIQEFSLKNQYFLEGVANLNSLASGLGFSVELILPPPEVPQLTNPRFTATTSGVTLAEALDWLCTLEPQYTWSRDGTTINIFPRATVEEKNYYFTRKLSDLVFREERNAYDAVEKVFKPVSTPKEAVIQWTGVRDYQTPYSATFKDITVREALNRLVQHVAPTEGWMVFGNRETMLLTMYDYISARSSAAH